MMYFIMYFRRKCRVTYLEFPDFTNCLLRIWSLLQYNMSKMSFKFIILLNQ